MASIIALETTIVALIKIFGDGSIEKHGVEFRDDSSEQKSFYPRSVGAVGDWRKNP